MRRTTRRQILQSSLAFGVSAIVSPAAAAGSSPKQELIDCHVHLTHGWYAQEGGAITAAHLLHWMDEHHIDRAVVLPLVSPEAFWYPVTTDHVLTATAPHRDRLIPFCSIDPRTLQTHLTTQSEVVDLLRRYHDAGARGFGEHKPRLTINDPLSLRLYEACCELRMPVLIHLDNQANMDAPGLPGLAEVLARFPELVMIGHGKGWWASISGNLRQEDLHVGYPLGPVVPGGAVDALMDAFPNLYGDLSSSGAHAMLRDKEFGKAFLTRRASRLLFGTDYYLTSQVEFQQFTLFDELGADADVRRMVGYENARRILHLNQAVNS
jgi:predicted TIM-barrel fold metal-dependent hydrolase